MARRSRKASLLAYDLRERGIKLELVILHGARGETQGLRRNLARRN
jgi:hypothetical protein